MNIFEKHQIIKQNFPLVLYYSILIVNKTFKINLLKLKKKKRERKTHTKIKSFNI